MKAHESHDGESSLVVMGWSEIRKASSLDRIGSSESGFTSMRSALPTWPPPGGGFPPRRYYRLYEWLKIENSESAATFKFFFDMMFELLFSMLLLKVSATKMTLAHLPH